MMNNKDMMKKLVKEFGFDAVKELAARMQEEIKREEQQYKNIIPLSRYGCANGKTVEFPDWVIETVDRVVSELGITITKKGDGNSQNLAVTNEQFARYIAYTCNDDGRTLRTVLEILMSAPAWCKGYGMTRSRMELVFHILVLHKDARVASELKSFLAKYDPTALKVFANADEAFRHTLNHECQMIAFTEREVCKAIEDTVKFNYAA